MRLSALTLLFVCLYTSVPAYTIVLKSGRMVQGERIGEDGRTLQLRDPATGLILSCRIDQVDVPATQLANAESPQPRATAATPAPGSQSLAELARRTQEQRTGRARSYSSADVSRMPELSFSGAATEPVAPVSASDSVADTPDERRWRSDSRALRKELEAAEDRYASAASACDRARNRPVRAHQDRPQDPATLFAEPAECKRLPELQERISRARERIEDFEERARKAGIPWRWVE